ncbi:GNAT family N-acetyltransferase [Streptococcus acidominimus]|uniref:N-acetyltransferase n=1 Tax=Streptococcus acidominimus TaxID=1326 RepID=A0A4Y9FPS9_STRAI|nr:GNAT family N-acetyltransferase [Streptococcus acidominimus]MBF0818444.1 GNAT family N-acetyltransferase [Streptococcus acidominimus]MBF0838028.1 GNAT family N-acetyltransferase [Streptococcus acidominimus]MBF0848504.1 GNAT family N-acetyltransferase [Streptococcus danieliae]TFU31227.1 N-acetyltransferase [Streptococcus acidominimus]
MEIQKRIHLSEEEMQQVLDLLYTCHKADKTISTPYLENTYQFDKSMPYLFLAYEENRLLGFLSVCADVQDDVNVSLFVLPSVRKQGIASACSNCPNLPTARNHL